MKTDLVTGRDVPDETKRVPLLTYPGARPAAWPQADYIVGNPPFLGNKRMRDDLGDGYAETLRAAYPEVPESADFVMYWWHKAAALVRSGSARRFGLITTNSLRQTFNRRVVEGHLKGSPARNAPVTGGDACATGGDAPATGGGAPATGGGAPATGGDAPATGGDAPATGGDAPVTGGDAPVTGGDASVTGGNVRISGQKGRDVVKISQSTPVIANAIPLSLLFAIPDHPWVDTAEGAAVRIAMTVGTAGEQSGELRTVATEEPHDDGSYAVTFTAQTGRIASDLSVGADVTGTVPLKANEGLAGTGLILGSRGFVLTAAEATDLTKRNAASKFLIFPLRNGDDINGEPRNAFVIDTHGWEEDRLRREVPEIYQRLYTTVYRERQSNRDPKLRKYWWLFRRSNEQVRGAIAGLPRYIATVETSKHRVFVFLDVDLKPEHKLVVIGSSDAFHLGVLNSRIHGVFALSRRAQLGPTPVYPKTECFDPFPFPACEEAAKARIRALGEELDAHRKRVQAQHPGLSLTAMYNVLEKLRAAALWSAVAERSGDTALAGAERRGRESAPTPPAPPAHAKAASLPPHSIALTAKERATHDAGLVSVLRQLHDELDAAVAAAYGFAPDSSDAEILTRLVALNAARAAEDAAGQIRWLRPTYQSRKQGAGKRRSGNSAADETPRRLRLPAPCAPLPACEAAVAEAAGRARRRRRTRPPNRRRARDRRDAGETLPARETRRPRRNPGNARDARAGASGGGKLQHLNPRSARRKFPSSRPAQLRHLRHRHCPRELHRRRRRALSGHRAVASRAPTRGAG